MKTSTLCVWALAGAFTLSGCFMGGEGDEDDGDGGGTSSGPWLPGGGGGDGGGSGGGNSSADDDGDGFTNGEEADAGTNPDYEYSHPYTGDYNVGMCENGVAEGSTGPSGTDGYGSPLYQEGDVAANFTFMDQHGEDVSLYSFCGHTVMLVNGAFW